MPGLIRTSKDRPASTRGRSETEGQMSLVEHLEELRRRLIICVVTVVATTVVAFIFSGRLMDLILNLVAQVGVNVQAIEVAETFTTAMRLALIGGIALAMPVLVYQTWGFLRPGLTPNERRYILIGLPMVILFFAGGVLFSYFIALPAALRFLLNFASDKVRTEPQLQAYLSFVSTLLLWSGISFEMPIFLFFLAKIRVVDWRRLSRWRKFALLIICVIAAVITPTADPVNMLIVAAPLYLLYELGIVLARFA